MAISVNPMTCVITVPQADLTHVSGTMYELDLDDFRMWLKDWEDDQSGGITHLKTHNHNTEVTLSGTTYARIIEVLDPYTVEFEDGQYTINCVGANHNLADVKVPNQVSLIVNNSAGYVLVETGASGLTSSESDQLTSLYKGLKNKKAIVKSGSVWQVIIYDDDDTTPIFQKDLKDVNGNDIDDLVAGVLASEARSTI